MTQKDIELLLKDLCCRLPYGVKVTYLASNYDVDYIEPQFLEIKLQNLGYTVPICHIKPHLRPLSSMTEEERKEFGQAIEAVQLTDWLNARMFDIRGLIPKGLALEAPKDMYKIKLKL